MPDIQLMFNGQCFPRYRYSQLSNSEAELFDTATPLECIDNISDTALRSVPQTLCPTIASARMPSSTTSTVSCTPPTTTSASQTILPKSCHGSNGARLPRLRFCRQALAQLHLNYETCAEYPLDIELKADNPSPEHFQIGTRVMRYTDDAKTTLIVNDHVQLSGIPAEAHHYIVNGRTPLAWFIDRYRITTDKRSGIVNDPNDWFAEPRHFIATLRRIVHVS